MALNLIRNSRVFFTSNVNATTGVIATTGATTGNTSEIQVLDGFSFSQNTNSEQVTVSEAGTAPVRGQRSFNTSLAPVDFSFSTYIRPKFSTNVLCEESVLWNALLGVDVQNTSIVFTGMTGAPTYTAATGQLTVPGTGMQVLTVGAKYLVNGITSTVPADLDLINGPATVLTSSATSLVLVMDNQSNAVSSTPTGATGTLAAAGLKLYTSAWGNAPAQAIASAHSSNVNQLQKFGMIIYVDTVAYAIDNCALNEATIDFGLDGIATAQWTGQATALREIVSTVSGNTHTGAGFAGTSLAKDTTANFITNKLSTARLKTAEALGGGSVGVGYYLAITGGSITVSNNISYITPALLGIVNSPITYYTATRSVTGTLNAYLNTGAISTTSDGVTYSKGTGELLKDLLAVSSTETEPMFYTEIAIGGAANSVRVELQMPSVSISIPSINTEQVLSTTLTFTAAPSAGAYSARAYDLTQTNELTVRYFAT
jgi:hypothetical protein